MMLLWSLIQPELFPIFKGLLVPPEHLQAQPGKLPRGDLAHGKVIPKQNVVLGNSYPEIGFKIGLRFMLGRAF